MFLGYETVGGPLFILGDGGPGEAAGTHKQLEASSVHAVFPRSLFRRATSSIGLNGLIT